MFLKDVLDNLVENNPQDLENDCWLVGSSLERPKKYYNGKYRLLYHATYMDWYELEENPFHSKLHASHTCDNSNCVNPLHITPETPVQNELRKMERPSAEAYREAQRQHQMDVKEGKIKKLPKEITEHKDKAQWYLDNKTYTDENGCRVWTGQLRGGYALHNVTVGTNTRRKLTMHRYIKCMLEGIPYGEDPADPWFARGKGHLVAHHKCENKACVNPEHIELVTRSENAIEITNWAARKLTEYQVRQIKQAACELEGSKADFVRFWSDKYNCSKETIYRILRGSSWKQVS